MKILLSNVSRQTKIRRRHRHACAIFCILAFLFFLVSLKAQVQVDLSLERNLYIAYEPLLVFVALTNMSGRDLQLESIGSQSWLGFNIRTVDGRWLAPCNSNESSVTLKAGSTINRVVNITPLFLLNDFGAYQIAATVFQSDLNRYFRSLPGRFEITQGRLLSQQEAGVPSSNETRLISFLVHQVAQGSALYLRIEDKTQDVVYCTHQLGGLVAYSEPEMAIDNMQSIHVLQSYAPRKFVYTAVNLDGKVLDRRSYLETKTRPALKKNLDGSITVAGGHLADLPSDFTQKREPCWLK